MSRIYLAFLLISTIILSVYGRDPECDEWAKDTMCAVVCKRFKWSNGACSTDKSCVCSKFTEGVEEFIDINRLAD